MPPVVHSLIIPTPSWSKCRHLQSLLQSGKSNVLRLNEISHSALLQIAALTSTRFGINRECTTGGILLQAIIYESYIMKYRQTEGDPAIVHLF